MTLRQVFIFIGKVSMDTKNPDGCWQWTGKKWRGYGVGVKNKKTFRAHRVAYEYWRCPIIHELDHLCQNKLCVNPWHLEDVTSEEHRRRSHAVRYPYLQKNICKNGHAFDEGNTLWVTRSDRKNNPYRYCRQCLRKPAKKSYSGRNFKEMTSWESVTTR